MVRTGHGRTRTPHRMACHDDTNIQKDFIANLEPIFILTHRETDKYQISQIKYRVIINDCPIAVGVENPHKFGMCR
jgi:hypothetical protein